MKWWIYCAALFLGLILGRWLEPSPEVVSDDPAEERSELERRTPNRLLSGGSDATSNVMRILSIDGAETERAESFKELTKELSQKNRSPLRTRAFLGLKVQSMTKEVLIETLKSGEIQTQRELTEAARRLTEEDPHGVFDLYEKTSIRFSSMDNLYTFYNTMLDVWVKREPTSLLDRIKGLKRGGAQQDISLRFSDRWAHRDPAKAVEHFSELVYLRNLSLNGGMRSGEQAYAHRIVKSWRAKDEKGLELYIDNLPAGQQKDLFIQEWKKEP